MLEKMYHQNPWWENESSIYEDPHLKELAKNRYIFLQHNFLHYKFEDGVYIVTGPRQIGKTTHLKLLIQEHINKRNRENFFYFNCDILEKKSDIVEVVEEYLRNVQSVGRKYILLDEITAVKDSILGIKYLIDEGIKEGITYILTGSSTVNIKKTGEFLPGRRGKGKDFVFEPLDFAQFLSLQYPDLSLSYSHKMRIEKWYMYLKNKNNLKKNLEKYLICGGIPRVLNDYLSHGEIGLDNYELYRDWLISEIAKSGKRVEIAKVILERILVSLGSDISYQSFTSDTGVGSHNTIYDYVHFLEDGFVLKEILSFDYRQKRIQFRKNKKIYLSDPFLFWLLQWWLNGSFGNYRSMLKDSVIKSRLIENVCAQHLIRMFGDIFFFRKEGEIDFIYDTCAFECKYQNKVSPNDFKEILKFQGRKFIITKDLFKITQEYEYLPVELFLLLPKEYFLKKQKFKEWRHSTTL